MEIVFCAGALPGVIREHAHTDCDHNRFTADTCADGNAHGHTDGYADADEHTHTDSYTNRVTTDANADLTRATPSAS